MNAAERRAEKKLQDCFSFKGEDFCCNGNRSYVKRFTARVRRRLDKATVEAELHEESV